MKDKPTKPNGTLNYKGKSYPVFWDLVDNSVYWTDCGRKSLWKMDRLKKDGWVLGPPPPEAVKEVKPQGNTPFKWPDHWLYSMDDNVATTETLDPFERWIQEDLRSKKEDNVKLTGGPAKYYDLPYKQWDTTNDMGEYLAKERWKEYSLHFKDLLKALVRFGAKDGTSVQYDIEKMIYSGCRALVMLSGKKALRSYLQDLLDDPQFKE